MSYNLSTFTALKKLNLPLPYPSLPLITPQMYGAIGDGVSDDTVSFFNSVSAAKNNNCSLLISGNFLLSTIGGTSRTIDCNLKFSPDSLLVLQTGLTISYTGFIDAPPMQKIFSGSGIHSLVAAPFSSASVMWWGADPTESSDSQPAFQLAFNSGIMVVDVPYGTFKLNSSVTFSSTHANFMPSIRGIPGLAPFSANAGDQYGKSQIRYAGIGSAAFQFSTTTSGILCGAVIQGLYFYGDSSTTGIELRGFCGVTIENCVFDSNLYGVTLHNFSTNTFCEQDVLWKSYGTSSCKTLLQYKRTNGTNSFRGSGLRACYGYTAKSGNGTIIVGSGCTPYMSPLDLDVELTGTGTAASIIVNNGIEVNFFGHIRMEGSSGSTTPDIYIASGSTTGFVGTISAASNLNWATKSLQVSQITMITQAGALQAVGPIDWDRGISMTTGSNSYSNFNNHSARLATLTFYNSDNSYLYRAVLNIFAPSGASGHVVVLDEWLQTDTHTYGKPTYTVNSAGALVITNAGWPSTGISMNSFNQSSLSPDHTAWPYGYNTP